MVRTGLCEKCTGMLFEQMHRVIKGAPAGTPNPHLNGTVGAINGIILDR